MKTLATLATLGTLAGTLAGGVLGDANGVRAQNLPAFERDGYPLTWHQLEVLGPDGVYEQAPTSTLTQDGMPASPHQLAVLRHGKDHPAQ